MKRTYISISLLFTMLFSFAVSLLAQEQLIPVKIGDKFGYINRKGAVVIKAQFSEAFLFSEGLAVAATSGSNPKYGYINESGVFVIAPIYMSATNFCDSIAWVCLKSGFPVAIDKKGGTLFLKREAKEVNNFAQGMAAYRTTDSAGIHWGYMDKTGKVVIAPVFDFGGDFSEGVAAAKNKEGKYGYIDKTGNWVIAPKYEFGTAFIDGKAIVRVEGKYGVIDTKEHFFILPQYDGLERDGLMYAIKQDDKYGSLNKDGVVAIEPLYKNPVFFQNNKITCGLKGTKFGYIDQTGKFVIPPTYAYTNEFDGDLAAVMVNEKIGFIDTKGKMVIPATFTGLAEDYRNYISFHRPHNCSLTSDLTDVNTLAYDIRRTILNMNPRLPVSSFMDQHDLDESSIEVGATLTTLATSEVNSDVQLVYMAVGNPYTNNVFDRSIVPPAYVLSFTLGGKSSEKADQVWHRLKELCNETGPVTQNGDLFSFQNKGNTISMSKVDNVIILSIEITKPKD